MRTGYARSYRNKEIVILTKYLNYTNVVFIKKDIKLLKHTKIKYFIEIEKRKEILFEFIYSLNPYEL